MHKKDFKPLFDASKFSLTTKILLFPLFAKAFGLVKATILLYGRKK